MCNKQILNLNLNLNIQYTVFDFPQIVSCFKFEHDELTGNLIMTEKIVLGGT